MQSSTSADDLNGWKGKQAEENGVNDGETVSRRDLKVRPLPGATDFAASFEILEEDHTLGNALRFMIMKNPEVELCGYSMPHPAEAKLHIRIQTYEGTTVWDAFKKGLDDLMDLCNVVEEKFIDAREDFIKDNMEDW